MICSKCQKAEKLGTQCLGCKRDMCISCTLKHMTKECGGVECVGGSFCDDCAPERLQSVQSSCNQKDCVSQKDFCSTCFPKNTFDCAGCFKQKCFECEHDSCGKCPKRFCRNCKESSLFPCFLKERPIQDFGAAAKKSYEGNMNNNNKKDKKDGNANYSVKVNPCTKKLCIQCLFICMDCDERSGCEICALAHHKHHNCFSYLIHNDESHETDKEKNGDGESNENITKMKYTNGSVYLGSIKDNKRHGTGTMSYHYPKDSTYTGTWENDKRNGSGKFEAEDLNKKFVYEGKWKDDKRHGYGTLSIAYKGFDRQEDSFTYSGNFKDDQKWGEGTAIYSNREYAGDWESDVYSGFGTLTSEDGHVYSGFWDQGIKHGKGKETFKDGGVYEGQWVKGQRHGCGVFQWPNDDRGSQREYLNGELVEALANIEKDELIVEVERLRSEKRLLEQEVMDFRKRFSNKREKRTSLEIADKSLASDWELL